MENLCWICNTSFDPTKPVNKLDEIETKIKNTRTPPKKK
ncbi:MAG: hypothetical protein BAJALOKI1v1_1210009 [Promethearchaeota archaeon]|nr:MAG: hypothetical protein BAJALOKI1v1_1210009 [Candidatus Lokiarchaeota archaeon]